jgi:NDP-sugar pyrophosphorylase family protein
VLAPALFDVIPERRYYGIDQLIKDLLRAGRRVGKFLCRDFWLDIGQMEDYARAQDAYRTHFSG